MAGQRSIRSNLKSLSLHAPRIRTINAIVIVVASILALMLLETTEAATTTHVALHEATTQYVECNEAAHSFKDASNYLTSNARLFAVTFDQAFVDNFYTEVNDTKRRDNALDVLEVYLAEGQANQYLVTALEESNSLAQREGRAMRLVAESQGYALDGALAPLGEYDLSPDEHALSADEKVILARELLFGEEYRVQKDRIDNNVSLCTEQLIQSTLRAQDDYSTLLDALLLRQRVLTILFLVTAVFTILSIIFLILWPLASYSVLFADGKPLVESGSRELRLMAAEYNELYERNRRSSDRLRHKADHDPLTGLFNRGAYDELCRDYTQDVALMLLDVDYFKYFNDTYGHEVGDEVLKKLGRNLKHAFRTSDFPCRIGGDEFAVIVTDITPQLRHVIVNKIDQIVCGMADTTDGLPAATLSIGIAFSATTAEHQSLFKAADRALYVVKERGRNGFAFADELDDDASRA